MDYKEQIEQAKHAAEKWRSSNPIVGVGNLRVDLMVDDLTRSITDLLARAEATEARAEKAEKMLEMCKGLLYKERPCSLCTRYSKDWTPDCCKNGVL